MMQNKPRSESRSSSLGEHEVATAGDNEVKGMLEEEDRNENRTELESSRRREE
jgi:hypothetical protein